MLSSQLQRSHWGFRLVFRVKHWLECVTFRVRGWHCGSDGPHNDSTAICAYVCYKYTSKRFLSPHFYSFGNLHGNWYKYIFHIYCSFLFWPQKTWKKYSQASFVGRWSRPRWNINRIKQSRCCMLAEHLCSTHTHTWTLSIKWTLCTRTTWILRGKNSDASLVHNGNIIKSIRLCGRFTFKGTRNNYYLSTTNWSAVKWRRTGEKVKHSIIAGLFLTCEAVYSLSRAHVG